MVALIAAAALLPGSLGAPAAAMPAVEPSGTWGPPRPTDPGPGPIFALSTSGAVLHALTQDQDSGDDYYQRSSDGGATWQERAPVGGIPPEGNGLIATADAHVYVARARATTNHEWIVLRRNRENGRAGAWTAPRAITSPRSRVVLSSIAASGATVHIAAMRMATGSLDRPYERGRIVVMSSRNHGATWTSRVVGRVERRVTLARATVAASGRHVVLAWRSSTRKTVIRARVSHDSGRTWGATTTLGTGTTVSVAVLGSRVAVAAGIRAGGAWVRVHRGGSWTKKRVVPVGASNARKQPVVALHGTTQVGVLVGRYPADGSGLVLQWHESRDNGATWAAPVTIGTAEFGQVMWSSNGPLTIAYSTYLRTRT
jgi:hypothetical protein